MKSKSWDLFETRDIRKLDELQLDKLLELVNLAMHEHLKELEETSPSPQIGIVDDESVGQGNIKCCIEPSFASMMRQSRKLD